MKNTKKIAILKKFGDQIVKKKDNMLKPPPKFWALTLHANPPKTQKMPETNFKQIWIKNKLFFYFSVFETFFESLYELITHFKKTSAK